jgi:hypothetical protein
MRKFKDREVVLKNGEKVTGMVVPISPAKVLVQTDEMCLELWETEIQSLDGKERFRNLIGTYDTTIHEETMIHQYKEDGSMVSLHKMKHTNTSDRILGKLSFLHTSDGGMTKELEEHFNRQEHFDNFGHLLPITIEEKLENGWKYNLEFPIPVAPGEVYEITLKAMWPRWAHHEDDHWVTSHHILRSLESIYTVMFMLPEGAEFSSAEPQPLRQFNFIGKPTITWKRYLPADEDIIFEAKYKL